MNVTRCKKCGKTGYSSSAATRCECGGNCIMTRIMCSTCNTDEAAEHGSPRHFDVHKNTLNKRST